MAPKEKIAANPSRYSAEAIRNHTEFRSRTHRFFTSASSRAYERRKLTRRLGGPGGFSGTAKNTGRAKTANQAAENTATARMLSPPSDVTPNQPTSGAMKPTKQISSSTMPPK